MTVKNRLFLSTAAGLISIAPAGPLWAQTSGPAAPAVEEAAVETSDIVVTATRREQALQDVPIAVSAIGSEQLQNAQIRSTADLVLAVPNVNITSQVGGIVIFVRGVGQLSTNPGQEPSVATYVDGVYQPTVFGALTSLSNIQRVEVIKGPQGTLFGRNATGGLLNITTLDPSQETKGTIIGSYGNYDTKRLSAYVTTGLGEGVAADLSAYFYDQNKGVGRNIATGERLRGQTNIDVRSKILFNLGERTSLRLAASYTDNKSSTGNNLAILRGSRSALGTGALPGFYDLDVNLMPRNHNSTWQASGKIEHEFDNFDLISISSYTRTKDRELEDLDATPVGLIDVLLSQRTKIFTQELQLASKKGSDLTWIVGAFYYRSRAIGNPSVGLSGLAFGGGGNFSQVKANANSFAIYGEATYEVLPKLNLTLGGRYTRDKKSVDGVTESTDATGAIISSVPVNADSKSFKEPTYRAIADYHFTDDVMAYASYSRGFKSGGYDTGFPTGVAYKPETIDAYEIGLKTEMFDKRLRWNIAAFKYDYKNLQLPVLVPLVGGGAGQITVNATSAKVKGVDIDGNFKLNRYVNLNWGLGYLDSKNTSFPNAPCSARTPAGDTISFACDVSGFRTTNASKWTYNVGATMAVPTEIGTFAATASYAHQSRFYFDLTNRLPQNGYGKLNGQIGWTSTDERLGVSLFAENLLNTKYTVVQYAQAGLGDSYAAGRPRMYGVELRAKF